MKKTSVVLAAAALLFGACTGQNDYEVSSSVGVPAPVAYTDWDRAIRVDVICRPCMQQLHTK